ncbi:MAG: hypothetical protein ABI867_15485 [Kofleriaceae bacterium]
MVRFDPLRSAFGAATRPAFAGLVALVALVACSGRPPHPPPSSRIAGPGVEVTLYRDHAVVAHRVEVVVPAASTATVRLTIAAGVDPESIYVVEKSELTVRSVRSLSGTPKAKPGLEPCDEVACVLDNYRNACCAKFKKPVAEPADDDEEAAPAVPEPPALPEAPLVPTEVELVIAGPHEGKYTLVVGYDTERISWDAAYTMTTTPARTSAVVHGAIAVRNATGIPLVNANVWVIDTDHGPATGRVAERLGAAMVPREGNTTPTAKPRDLGRLDLVDGDTRIELLPIALPRPMKSVLVYDPIGNKLDHPGTSPVRDATLGVVPAAPARVSESFEITRDATSDSLPAGPVRLLERRPDGSLALLGEARLYDASTRSAKVDAVAVGTAEGVVGKRERRELTIDDDGKRLVEEFVITIDNARAHPVEVVLREHFYRGQNWTLAYQSVPLGPEAKEGSQQVAIRITVPPKQVKPGQTKVLYVVVYTW